MGTTMYYLPVFNLVLIIVSTLYYIKEIVIPFKKQSRIGRIENIKIENGNFYQTSWKNITINIDKAKKELENRNYEQAIRFLSSALLTSIDLSTECYSMCSATNIAIKNTPTQIQLILLIISG